MLSLLSRACSGTKAVKLELVLHEKLGPSFGACDGTWVPLSAFSIAIGDHDLPFLTVLSSGDGLFTLFDERSATTLAQVKDKKQMADFSPGSGGNYSQGIARFTKVTEGQLGGKTNVVKKKGSSYELVPFNSVKKAKANFASLHAVSSIKNM